MPVPREVVRVTAGPLDIGEDVRIWKLCERSARCDSIHAMEEVITSPRPSARFDGGVS